jgi:hypothetical protein
MINYYENIAFVIGNIALSKIFLPSIDVRVLIYGSNHPPYGLF